MARIAMLLVGGCGVSASDAFPEVESSTTGDSVLEVSTGSQPLDPTQSGPVAAPANPQAAPQDACGALPVVQMIAGVPYDGSKGAAVCIIGTDGDDLITGSKHDDIILGLGGDDTIDGGKGDDVIFGGDGNDVISGGGGTDEIHGDAGDDIIVSDKKDEKDGEIDGGDGNDTCVGCESPPIDPQPCATAASCPDDGNACTTTVCNPIAGCLHMPVVCDDGLYCNGFEYCDGAGGCVAGILVPTDDGVDCTLDVCDEGTQQVTHAVDDTVCPPNPCAPVSCDAIEGCVYEPLPDGTPCDDHHSWTLDEACFEGVCMQECDVVATGVIENMPNLSESGEYIGPEYHECLDAFTKVGMGYYDGMEAIDQAEAHPDGDVLYIHGAGDGENFQALDLTGEFPTRSWGCALAPLGLARDLEVSADGQVAYVVQADAMHRVDLVWAGACAVDSRALQPADTPSRIALAADHDVVYAALVASGLGAMQWNEPIALLDTFDVTANCPEGGSPCVALDVAIDAQNHLAFVAAGGNGVFVVDVSDPGDLFVVHHQPSVSGERFGTIATDQDSQWTYAAADGRAVGSFWSWVFPRMHMYTMQSGVLQEHSSILTASVVSLDLDSMGDTAYAGLWLSGAHAYLRLPSDELIAFGGFFDEEFGCNSCQGGRDLVADDDRHRLYMVSSFLAQQGGQLAVIDTSSH